MAILSVGSGKQFATIKSAVAASRDGDVVAIDAGTYTNDFATITTDITLQGVGGLARLVATVAPPNGKAILTTQADVTLDRIELTGAKVADMNGAGVRIEGAGLTILNSYIHDNQDGILGTSGAGAITIRNTEFSHNGAGDGRSHNIYVSGASLYIADSYIHDAVVGHQVKSRALNTTIIDSRIHDDNGSASYSVDVPNGGHLRLQGNVIEQGPNSQNPAIIAVGEEGVTNPSSIIVSGNTIIDDKGSGTTSRMLWNATGATAQLTDNRTLGITSAETGSGPLQATGTIVLATRPSLDASHPWAAAPPPAPAPAPAPVQVTLGTGSDTLVLRLSQDAFQGSAQYTVKVDGVQIGGTQTAAAWHSSGQSDSLTIKGNWTTGSHSVVVTFLNDAYGGTPAADRNLHVDGMTYNGAAVANGTAALLSAGPKAFTVGDDTPVPAQAPAGPTLGAGSDTLVLRLSQDAFQGSAQYTVKVDNQQIGGTQTAVALHGAGQSDTVTVKGNWATGSHGVTVTFLNDAYGGTPGTDRNLYVDGMTYDGVAVASGTAALLSGGPATFIVQDVTANLGATAATADQVFV